MGIVNRLRFFCALVMASGLLTLVGCGGGNQVQIQYEILPAQGPGGAAPPTSTPPSPGPRPTPLAPTATTTARPAATPTATAIAPDEVLGVPITGRVELEAPYEIHLRLKDEKGRVVATDRLSPDGYGLDEKLLRVPPGRYRLQLWTHPLGEARPLYDKVIELTPEYPPRFHFGLLTIDLPQEGTARFREGITIQVLEDPSLQMIWEAPLGDAAVRTTFGDLLPDQLILPFGAYSVRLVDRDTKDDVHLVAQDGLPMARTVPIPFQLSKATPSVLIDMSPQLGLGALRPGGR